MIPVETRYTIAAARISHAPRAGRRVDAVPAAPGASWAAAAMISWFTCNPSSEANSPAVSRGSAVAAALVVPGLACLSPIEVANSIPGAQGRRDTRWVCTSHCLVLGQPRLFGRFARGLTRPLAGDRLPHTIQMDGQGGPMSRLLEIEIGPVKLIVHVAGSGKPSAPPGTNAARAGRVRSEEEIRG